MSTITPSWTPRVTNQPISLNGVISNINDCMISSTGRTSNIIKDSTGILFEVVIGIEMSGMRSMIIDGLGKSISAFIVDEDSVVV